MKIETHIVPKRNKPERLQEYGVGIFINCPTKSALKKAIKRNTVQVNGKPASTATFITGGETLQLTIHEKKAPTKKLDLTLDVLFEDQHLAVIHKPAGIEVSGNSFKNIARALPQNLIHSDLFDASTPQPVHRLDHATTGLLLVGKTNSSIRQLNRLFEEKKVRKIYYAVCIGKIPTFGKINQPVDDKQAASLFNLCHKTPSKRFGHLNLVKLQPKTGRRHQLRKHLSGMGNPILGDKDYGKEGLILKGKGLYLHAFSLDFTHPFTGEQLHLEDELPKKFSKLFPQYGPI